MNVARHVVVRGGVQGVGYRAFVDHEASRRGLSGWVRNRSDGTVEAVFAGEAALVDGMVAACRKGPLGARVEGVEVREAVEAELPRRGQGTGFSVLPTA